MALGKLRIKFKKTTTMSWLISNKYTIAFIILGATLGILAFGVLINHKILGAIFGIFASIIIMMLFRKDGINYFDKFFAGDKLFSFLVLVGSIIMAFNYIPVSKELLDVIRERYFGEGQTSLGLVYATISLYILTLVIIFCFLYLGLRWGLKIFEKQKTHNNYLIWTIILIMFTLILGLTFIQDTYNSKFPMIINFPNNSIFSSNSRGYCTSLNNYDVFVVGDSVNCKFNLVIENATLAKMMSSLVYSVDYTVYPGQSYNAQKAIAQINSKPSFEFDYGLLLKNEGMSDVVFNFAMINATDPRNFSGTVSTERYAFETITLNNYHGRTKDLITNLVLLISISVFSILSGMFNLKGIMNKKD